MARFVAYTGRRPFLEPTAECIAGIEEAIQWAEVAVPRSLRRNMDKLCYVMAIVNQRYAREMSFGPYDPSQRGRYQFLGRAGFIAGTSGPATPNVRWDYTPSSALAWKIPVRRITGAYYLGWKVKRLGLARWMLYNDSREAYYIEFGINWLGGNRRVRRPIRKLSLRKTLNFMMTTEAYHRIWADIYAPPETRHGKGFTQTVQSAGMGTFTGPMLGRFLPG